MPRSARIRQRYFRQTIAHPDGSVCHHGDCYIFSRVPVCTCGLLHDLMPVANPSEIYSKYEEDLAKHLGVLDPQGSDDS